MHAGLLQAYNALCRYRYFIGIHLGIRDLDQNRKMTVISGIEVGKTYRYCFGIDGGIPGVPNPYRHRALQAYRTVQL